MMVTDPPRLATWLLQRFAWGPRGESLVGDLLEQYQQKRSSAWYWRQVVTAILARTTSEVAAHKLLAVRAVAVGGLVSVLFSVPVHWLGEIARASINDWIAASGHYSFWPVFLSGRSPSALFESVAGAAIGGIVARPPPRGVSRRASSSVQGLCVVAVPSARRADARDYLFPPLLARKPRRLGRCPFRRLASAISPPSLSSTTNPSLNPICLPRPSP